MMDWIKWWSTAEGKDIQTETGDGYFLLRMMQARPHWLAFVFGIGLAAISFPLSTVMANSSPPEPVGYWFFLLFGIFAIAFCFGIALLTWLRKATTTCLVSEGRISWNDESGLPRNLDHRGEIEIASIRSIEIVEWHDGTDRGIEFELGGEMMRIEGSLGPALCGSLWMDDFLDAVLYWNPDLGDAISPSRRATPVDVHP